MGFHPVWSQPNIMTTKNCRTTKWLFKQKGRPSWDLFWKSVFPTKTNKNPSIWNKKSPKMLRSGPWFPPNPPFRVRRLTPFLSHGCFFVGQKFPQACDTCLGNFQRSIIFPTTWRVSVYSKLIPKLGFGCFVGWWIFDGCFWVVNHH